MSNKALKALDNAIADLRDQLEGLEEARAQIAGTRPSRTKKAPKAAAEKGEKKRGTRKFNAAQRKEASERMKKIWADRRGGKPAAKKASKKAAKKKATKKVSKKAAKKAAKPGRAKKGISGVGNRSSNKMYSAWQAYQDKKKQQGQPENVTSLPSAANDGLATT